MKNEKTTDDELIAAVKNGSEEALGSLIDRYSAYVRTVVLRITGSRLTNAEAEEIAAEAFFRLWKNAAFINEGKTKTFLARTARNLSIDAIRRSKPMLQLNETVVIPIEDPETEAIKQAEYEALQRALDSLPAPDRELLIGHYYFAKTGSELAAEYGLPVNTVKTKLRRGKEKLRRELEKGVFYEKKDNRYFR